MKLGLVLSGGAAFGIANIGVLEALEEEGITPDYIAGSSMGAIVGALYALGHPVIDLKRVAKEMKMTSMASISEAPLKNGLHGGLLRPKLREILSEMVGDACIADTKIPFVCIAGRVKEPIAWHKILLKGFTGHVTDRVEKYVFPPETLIIDAIMASSALPVIFSPVTIGKDTFVDLCHFGAIPSRSLREIYHPDVVIATDTSPQYPRFEKLLPPAWQNFMNEGYKELQQSRDACDVLMTPKLSGAPFRFDLAEQFIRNGKEEAQKYLPEIQAKLSASL